MTTLKEQIENAVKWIDELPNYKQGNGSLGNEEDGYCCLGVGCVVTNIVFERSDGASIKFRNAVGLIDATGFFNQNQCGNIYYGEEYLTSLNDETKAGFKRIANLLKTKPHWMFTLDVAQGIAKHYAK